jgi:hypothetical protein
MKWISQNLPVLAIILGLVANFFPFFQFIQTKKAEARKNNFETYHRLIGELVDSQTPRIDRQIAVVFELRNFENYFSVTVRILNGLKTIWRNIAPPVDVRLFQEIDLTLIYIEKRKRWWFFPVWVATLAGLL